MDLPAIKPWLILTPTQKKPGTPVVLFSGCTAVNARPRWIAKARELLATWGYQVLDSSGFTCCGGTLHHAGRYKAQDEVRQKNIQVWRDLGRPLVASFCASCKHSLDEYAAVLPEDEAAQWKEKCRGLSALLEQPRLHATADAPTAVAYHQPCHWGTADPDLPLLQQGLPELKKGAGLCCGMGGILKMSNPDLSMDMARKCLEGFAPEARHVITGCSGCVMQLSSVATAKNKEVRHWLDIVAVEAGA